MTFPLTSKNMLETLSITVSIDKKLALDPHIATFTLRVFELFQSNDVSSTGNIVAQSVIHRVEHQDI